MRIYGDFFKKIHEIDEQYDLIVADPPYDVSGEYFELMQDFIINKMHEHSNFLFFTQQSELESILKLNRLILKRIIIWVFFTPSFCGKRLPIPRYTPILWFVKSNQYFYNSKSKYETNQKTFEYYLQTGSRKPHLNTYANKNQFSDVIYAQYYKNEAIKKRDHKHHKPESLLQQLVDTFCPANGSICDCFAGSFALEQFRKKYIGFELNNFLDEVLTK